MQNNVIPGELTASFNIRLDRSKNHEEFEAMINRWCEEAGEGVHLEFIEKGPKVEYTVLDETNIFWTNFKSACDRQKIHLELIVSPAQSDNHYIRMVCT